MHNAEELAKLKKDALAELCRQYGVSGYSRMKKDEMIAAVAAAEKAAAKKAPAGKAKAEKPAAEKVTAKKVTAEKAPAEKAPAEKAPAKKAPAGEDDAEKGANLCGYCSALVNLWGIAPIGQIISAYSLHHGKKITADDVKSLEGGNFVVDGEELIHNSLAGKPDEIKALRERKAGYPFYLPSADEVSNFSDPAFREKSHAFAAMSGFLARTFKITEDKSGEITGKILGFLNSESGIETILAPLRALGVKFGDAVQFRNFGVLVDNLKNSARLWEFNGHTAAEARNFTENSGPVRVIKVGRNDPCPCGSGKKYKKCCGR